MEVMTGFSGLVPGWLADYRCWRSGDLSSHIGAEARQEMLVVLVHPTKDTLFSAYDEPWLL